MVGVYHEFSFDSLDASATANSTYASTDTPLFMMDRLVTSVAAMKILEVQIPFTYYVYNSTNNTFTLTANGHAPVTVTIPVGNYTVSELATVFGAALNLVGATTYTVTYSDTTAKYTITDTANVPFTFTFGASPVSPSILLGFAEGVSATSTSDGTHQILVAPNVSLLTGPNYLYLNSNTMGQMFSLFLPEGARYLNNGTRGPQMAKIPVNVQPNGIIYWTDPCPDYWFDMENLSNLASIDFYLTLGNNSSVVRLNGLSFSIKLGMLLNETDTVSVGASLRKNDRVVKTVR